MKKGQIWVSAVLYLLITAVVVVLILEGGLPLLSKMSDKATFTRTRDNFINLDQHIIEVAQAEVGTQRAIPLEIRAGELSVENDVLKWTMETDAEIIEPRSEIRLGNLRILSCADVETWENGTHYFMENSNVKFAFRKIGSQEEWGSLNTSDLIEYAEYLPTGEKTDGEFDFYILGEEQFGEGNGYVRISEIGDTLAEATVTAFINTTDDPTDENATKQYELSFTLESNTDFVRVKAVMQ
ncbi:hypothetical protein JW968_06005 [Candidatus Woesearchaeota archaeon]|nr:hypothetical protein [Candidatus Woesearchaeota archaeon]